MPALLKLVAVGETQVGKTCLFIAYAKNTFPTEYVPTVFENYVVDEIVGGIPVSMALWDTHGSSDDHDRLRPLSYPMTDVFIICFSIDNRESLARVGSKWVPELRHFCPDTPIVLIACKIDLREKGPDDLVSYDEGSKVADDLNLGYIETSSRHMQGLKTGFDTVIRAGLQSATTTTIKPWFKRRINTPPVMPPAGKAPRIEIKTSTFAEDWMAMHENPVHADVTFVLGGGQHNLDAHKIVLCSASEYFRRVFEKMPNKLLTAESSSDFFAEDLHPIRIQGIVAVYDKDYRTDDIVGQGHRYTMVELSADIKPKTFVRVLQFLYSGVPKLTNPYDEIDQEEIADLIRTSDIFELPRLTEICQNCLTGLQYLNPSIGTSHTDEVKQKMKELYLTNSETADVVFTVEDRRIHCHKSVLSARCKPLAAMIGNDITKDEATISEVYIPTTSAGCFQTLVEYLYTDHTPVNDIDRMELIALVDEYEQQRLMNLCELYVTQEINRNVTTNIEKAEIDVIGLLQKSQKCNAEQLSSWCLHFISTNYTAFRNRKEYSLLNKENKTYIEEKQWPPVSYLREVEQYKKKIKRNKCSLKCSIM